MLQERPPLDLARCECLGLWQVETTETACLQAHLVVVARPAADVSILRCPVRGVEFVRAADGPAWTTEWDDEE